MQGEIYVIRFASNACNVWNPLYLRGSVFNLTQLSVTGYWYHCEMVLVELTT